MSDQAHLWSRYHAAAIQTRAPEAAARAADKALAEYNKRFETLAKYEKELSDMAGILEVREAQAFGMTQWLIGFQNLLDEIAHVRDGSVPAEVKRALDQVSRNGRGRLDLRNGEYVFVPNGWPAEDPRLGKHR